MAFTEFTVRPGGSNLNAGTLDGSAEASTTPLVTYTNGGWNSGTGVFTPASGSPVGDGVAVGHWVSVYTDGASAPTGFHGRVTARDATTITVSTTAKSGTAPTTGASGLTLVVGGAWAGPGGASGFPFGFVAKTATDAGGNYPRVNFKAGTYSVTAAVAHGAAGPVMFQGYTSTFGDGGFATLDGGTSGASYDLLTLSGQYLDLADFKLSNNGATGNANGLVHSSLFGSLSRVAVTGVLGAGFSLSGGQGWAAECEAYACNASNSGGLGAFLITSTYLLTRCVAHDNAGGNNVGFTYSSTPRFVECIADTNGSHGFYCSSGSGAATLLGCDSYNNGGDGVLITSGFNCCYVENCNLVKNSGYGVNFSSATDNHGLVRNCGFGSGTQANASGQTNNLGAVVVAGSVTYASGVTPWADPANGDFRVALAAAKAAGRGAYTQTQGGYAGTVGYPDIGAAQHQDSGGAGGRAYILGG